MAYVSTGKITKTLGRAFSYASGHKETKDGKRSPTLSTGINCTASSAYKVSRALELKSKALRGERATQAKDGEEIFGWHFQQNFLEPAAVLSPETAHEIGIKLAEELFPGFPAVVGTHTNTSHVHNHIVIGAWGMDLKKHNNSNRFYQSLRAASDRLCEEYGLNVLGATKKVRLVKWENEAGETRYFEPTERKARERKKKEFARPGDYRDTEAFKEKNALRGTNASVIEKDIDGLIGSASSYEQLLSKLRAKGYEIRDKNASGGWLKHISFKAPGQGKGTRDSSLGDGEYYTREALEKTINLLAVPSLGKELNNAAAIDTAPAPAPAIEPATAPAPAPAVNLKEDDVMWPKQVFTLAEESWLKGREKAEKEIGSLKHSGLDLDGLAKLIFADGDKKMTELKKEAGLLPAGILPTVNGKKNVTDYKARYLLGCINDNLKSLEIITRHKITSLNDAKERINNALDDSGDFHFVIRNFERIEGERRGRLGDRRVGLEGKDGKAKKEMR
ncbi:MAG: relaxase/mobilization nuclease domain-containing protein [Lachnospiraceae bacterium]|nr:relaxase/mobilization nuclease domain-containing protein [Lachnospiraceae bacterium]